MALATLGGLVPALPFVNRFDEMAALRDVFEAPGAALVRIYGRRRLGKTEMLIRLASEFNGVYLLVDDAEAPIVLSSIEGQLSRQLPETPRLGTWDDLWDAIRDLAPPLVVLDEFQRLFENSREAVTRLQDRWDRELKRGETKIVLCGSSVGMMQRITQGRRGPLFGRLDRDLRLRSFHYGAVRLLYPGLPEDDRVARYAVFGGTPYYHQFSVGRPLPEAIREAFLGPAAPLAEEPQNLLQYELRQSSLYNSILYELGNGTHDFGEIASKTRVRGTSLGPYLRYLTKEFDLVQHDDPVLGKKKRARYRLSDPFFGFYYRFVFPNLARIEVGKVEEVLADILEGLDAYVGEVFEQVAQQTLVRLQGTTVRGLAVDFDEIGAWWNRVGEEIDIVAPSKGACILGEVKWTRAPPGPDLVGELERKTQHVDHLGKRTPRPVIVSRMPAGDKLEAALAERGGCALSLRDIGKAWDERYAVPEA